MPMMRMRAAGQQGANEKRLSAVGSSADVHAAVHLGIAKPGTLAAETEVRGAARRCAAVLRTLTHHCACPQMAKSRRLHDLTRVMVIEETYKQRQARTPCHSRSAPGSAADASASPCHAPQRTRSSGDMRRDSFARLSYAAMTKGSLQASPERAEPGGEASPQSPGAPSRILARSASVASSQPLHPGGLALRVALYTQAATRAVADAKRDLQLHSGWLRWLWLARTQLNALMNDSRSSVAAQVVYWLVVSAIVMSSTTFCLETVHTLDTPAAQRAYDGVEHVSIAVFTAEYGARLLSSPQLRPFFFNWLNTIDLAAILPYYVERGLVATGHVVAKDAGRSRIVRVLRVARVVRVLKLGNRSVRIGVVNRAIAESSDMLVLLGFLIMICVVTCSSAMFYAERGTFLPEYGFSSRQPFDLTCREAPACTAMEMLMSGLCCTPKPSPFRSIPSAFWWCIVTLMTVGYGDVVPVTPGGKIVACVTMVLAVLLLSLPISVIGTEFTQQWLEYKAARHMPDKRHKAPRFMALRRALAAHNSLLDELLLKTRDVLFEIDDLTARLQDKSKQHKRDASALAARASASTMRGKHAAALAAAAAVANGKERGSMRRIGHEDAARDIKHETELLFMELELKQRLMRLQELLTQAALLRDPAFLRALEQCRSTYGGLRALARDVVAITEEADDVEEELDAALTVELAAAAAAADAAAVHTSRSWVAVSAMRTLRLSSGRIRMGGMSGMPQPRPTRTTTVSNLAAKLASVLRRSPVPRSSQPHSPPRWRASDPLPEARKLRHSQSSLTPAAEEEAETSVHAATPRTPRTPLASFSAPIPASRFGAAADTT